jgi:hypothetical protein
VRTLVFCEPACFNRPAVEPGGDHFATIRTNVDEPKTIEEQTLFDAAEDVTISLNTASEPGQRDGNPKGFVTEYYTSLPT